ncbi:hypothetical protein [Spirochaeta isovalerica]|uniref:Lipoprotein n=1 Tax=Spirochaeta isovalerica TaxID=150 RepID=A0A841RAP5_9SPIO|nr:hypothetical protein [Spirochaeta isovalerica]MBB6481015.1 hypothetical protein [Spirochaeta isovalerica]
MNNILKFVLFATTLTFIFSACSQKKIDDKAHFVRGKETHEDLLPSEEKALAELYLEIQVKMFEIIETENPEDGIAIINRLIDDAGGFGLSYGKASRSSKDKINTLIISGIESYKGELNELQSKLLSYYENDKDFAECYDIFIKSFNLN